MVVGGPGGLRTLPPGLLHHGPVATYEYRAVSIPPHADREQTRQMLAIHAEFGDWELASHSIYAGGRRSVTVRRRVRSEPMPPLAT